MLPYIDIIGLCHSVEILWEIDGCEVATLPFQANANYVTWSIDYFVFVSLFLIAYYFNVVWSEHKYQLQYHIFKYFVKKN